MAAHYSAASFLAPRYDRDYEQVMTMSQIRRAIERGGPFSIQMADGRMYEVPHPDYISIPPKGSFVVVFNDDESAVVLPLLTMTGLTYQEPVSSA